MCVVVHTHVLTPIFIFALKASVCKLAPVLCEFSGKKKILCCREKQMKDISTLEREFLVRFMY